MQICKHFFAIFIALNLFLGVGVFAQNQNTQQNKNQNNLPSLPSVPKGPPKSSTPTAPTPPTAPSGGTLNMPTTSIQMPQMPSVSAPVPGSGFYTPGKQYQQNQKPAEKQEEPQAEQKPVPTPLEQITTDVTSALNGLSAWDLNQLAQRGALGSLSSLNALANNQTLGASNLNAANQQKLLTQILMELEQLKAEQKNLTAAPAVGTKPSALPPRIVRFTINSKDILESCTQVYFSEQENDGTFLLTGDVRTLVGRETILETFHLWFTASGTKNSRPEYSVTSQLMQSKQLETPLKVFCDVENFTASRTGNLVTLNYTVNENTFNLLLDIGKAR